MQYHYVIILMHLVLGLSQAAILVVVTLVSHYSKPRQGSSPAENFFVKDLLITLSGQRDKNELFSVSSPLG